MGSTDKHRVTVSGMTCDSCARHVEDALKRAGVRDATVDWRRGEAIAVGGSLDVQTLEAAIADSRYGIERVVRIGDERPANGGSAARDYDLVVIGSGGGAFAGAIRARDLGKRVLMVEHGVTGGTCVNVGCVPSKNLLVASERARVASSPSLREAVTAKAALVTELRQKKYVELLAVYDIAFREGAGRLIDPHTVAVDGEPVTAEAILIATGARPAVPRTPGLGAAGYLTSTSALELEEPPRRLAVLGAGPVGLELGQMLGNFGSEVIFIARRGLVPTMEPEVAVELAEALRDEGHRILAPASTTAIDVEGEEKVLRGTVNDSPFELRVDEILVATGRSPNTAALALDSVGIETDATGAIVVDAEQRTNVPSIYAAGDVTTQPRFVYVAAAGGAAAAENALGAGNEQLDFRALPQIVFTRPAIAQAGLTERDARERGLDVETTILPLDAVPRALVNGDTRGLFKLVADRDSGRLVGASILADGAPDTIQAAVLAIEGGLTVDQLSRTWAPYLAMAEGLKLAAQTFDRDVAKLSCCAA